MYEKKVEKLNFDYLQMYFKEPYVIDLENTRGKLVVYQPTIGDIISLGEERFYNTLYIFITNTTTYRLMLWKSGIDWNEISDFELFLMLYTGIDNEVSKLFFPDINWEDFNLYEKQDNEKTSMILYNEKDNIEINENVYNHFSQYLRNVFNIYPDEKLTNNAIMKDWFIQKDKRQLEINKEKEKMGKKEESSIQSIVSACVNHPGFKYKLHELRNVGVCEFYDSVKRLQIYESTTALMKGMYSGFLDAKEIRPEDYNFMQNFKR